MRCLIAILIGLSTISAANAERVRFCFLLCAIEAPATADSFCAAYERVIRSGDDTAGVKALSRTAKARLARNETLYRCACENWNNPICATAKP